MTVEKHSGAFVCTMSHEEFVGIFRTIGATNYYDRLKDPDIALTERESEGVSNAFADSVGHDERIMAERN